LKRSHFTTVAGRLAKLDRPRRADLHLHTTASDGDYTPEEVVSLARQANLPAIAITDHDTLSDVQVAQARAGSGLEVVPGVEISADYNGREVHLLGYFIRLDHEELNARLAAVRVARRDRFHSFVTRLAENGTRLPADEVRPVAECSSSLGRRHLARLLVQSGFAQSRHEAFHRLLRPLAESVVPKWLIPIREAIRLVRAAGGVASLAHPPRELTVDDFHTLADAGLGALEAEYPWARRSRGRGLRECARQLKLAITGGSDCHGLDPSHRRIGSYGITVEELTTLRDWSDQPSSAVSRS